MPINLGIYQITGAKPEPHAQLHHTSPEVKSIKSLVWIATALSAAGGQLPPVFRMTDASYVFVAAEYGLPRVEAVVTTRALRLKLEWAKEGINVTAPDLGWYFDLDHPPELRGAAEVEPSVITVFQKTRPTGGLYMVLTPTDQWSVHSSSPEQWLNLKTGQTNSKQPDAISLSLQGKGSLQSPSFDPFGSSDGDSRSKGGEP